MRSGVAHLGAVWVRFAVPAVVAIVIMATTEQIAGTTPVTSKVAPTGIVWHGRVFPARRDFDRWLAAHGSSYTEWARHHAALAAPPTANRADEASGLAGAANALSTGLRLLVLGIAGVTAIMFASALPFFVEKLRRFPARRPVRPLALGPDPVAAANGGDVPLRRARLRPLLRARPSADSTNTRTRRARHRETEATAAHARRRRATLARGRFVRDRRSAGPVARTRRRRHPWTAPVEVRLLRPSVFARTPAPPAYHYWIRTLRRTQPDVLWSIAGGALGALIGFLVVLWMV